MNQLIGICGLIGSGKDTVGDILVARHGYTRLSFAGTLKDMTAVLFDWDREMLEGATPESRAQREVPDPFWSNKLGRSWSPRIALQCVGTDVMRNHLHENIWLNTMENKLRKHNRVVITDVRFPNEIAFVQEQGVIWTVERGAEPDWVTYAKYYNSLAEDTTELSPTQRDSVHQSEWAWVGTEPDSHLNNNGSLFNLECKVNQLTLG